ncbi:NAD(P)/FAD-dependent oxidoreductase [Candidatus Nitrosocosmicus franklandus]|uniref:Geranylgeranyl reductase family protein n=1 Tax=Candidatus Nitrosocosmicus franklandianus TaxID=1798806 RepID=A0A484IGD6_9ARCH|nr:NAD(P)/FAD-dependent oxidoreductase [Candidatus Nitrosocosmicus franklandus]VFJ15250.1 Geranylgeranyl reductase family protein [Candidatus Nitrosocosmicus franklandus]
MSYDIAIVGGGPAGLSAAYSASKEGLKVALFEKDPSFGHNIRTSGVSWIKEMLKYEIPSDCYNPIKNFVFISPNNEIRISGKEDSACVLDVRKMYQYLASKAAAAGANLFVKSQVADISRDLMTKTSHLKVNSTISPKSIKAKLIIDASGFSSFVSRKLGYVVEWKRFGAGAEYECYCDNIDESTLTLMVGSIYSEAGYAWVFPLSKNRVRIGVGIGKPDSNVDPVEKLNKLIANRVKPLDSLGKIQPIEFHFGLIPNEGLRTRSIYEGLIMVGDVVGQANPLVLEGIRYAIEFGRLAGKVGADSIPFGCTIESLKPYEIANRKTLEKKINSALRVQERWLALSDAEWDKEIDIIKGLTIDEFLDFIKSDFTTSKMLKVALTHPKLLAKQLFNLVAKKNE